MFFFNKGTIQKWIVWKFRTTFSITSNLSMYTCSLWTYMCLEECDQVCNWQVSWWTCLLCIQLIPSMTSVDLNIPHEFLHSIFDSKLKDTSQVWSIVLDKFYSNTIFHLEMLRARRKELFHYGEPLTYMFTRIHFPFKDSTWEHEILILYQS